MSSRRYIPKPRYTYVAGQLIKRWSVYDTFTKTYVTCEFMYKSSAIKYADRRNAAILKSEYEYRKAKDNG